MNKTSKISYKTYFNNRLKPVYFHGQLTHPLYVQVTFERKTIFFKSYYFELFSKPRFALEIPGAASNGPPLEQVIEKEIEVIVFIIDKFKDDFSLETFKTAYACYSKDLCDVTEFGFITFLYTFFSEKRMPDFAELFKWGSRHLITYDLVKDLKKALKKDLYNELIGQAFQLGPPYLQLYGFMMQTKKWPILCLTAMEWDNLEMVKAFKEFVEQEYPNMKSTELIGQVNNWSNFK